MDITSEKTTLLSIALIFSTVGATLLATDRLLWGTGLLVVAVVILVVRGILEKKGIVAGKY